MNFTTPSGKRTKRFAQSREDWVLALVVVAFFFLKSKPKSAPAKDAVSG